MGRESGLLLIQIDGNDVEVNRRPATERQQDFQEPVTVFPSRQTHHDLVTVLDHAVIGNGLSHETAEAGLQAFNLFGLCGRTCKERNGSDTRGLHGRAFYPKKGREWDRLTPPNIRFLTRLRVFLRATPYARCPYVTSRQ